MTAVVFTDGRRSYIGDTIASFEAHVTGNVAERIIHDDSGDPDNYQWLTDTFPDWHLIHGTRGRLGFGGAVRNVWRHLTDTTGPPFIFHLEDDFTFLRPVNLDDFASVLDTRPGLAQLALRRQAWNAAERAAGGVIELNPAAYVDHTAGGHEWLEQRLFFTTNPSLYRRSLCQRGWPRGSESEGKFSAALLAAPDVWCGYWGARNSGVWVEHTGRERFAGAGY